MAPHLHDLRSAERALILRIAHKAHLQWLLQHGLVCSSAIDRDPAFVSIGNQEVIDRRRSKAVPVPPGGTLADYVPFYFTPFSPMLYNIETGWGVTKRPNHEIVLLVSSFQAAADAGRPVVFTDRHALLQTARFFSGRNELSNVDFDLLRTRDFRRDENDPEKFDRYQAEALVFEHLPVSALLGMACYTEEARAEIDRLTNDVGLKVQAVVRSGWYFQ